VVIPVQCGLGISGIEIIEKSDRQVGKGVIHRFVFHNERGLEGRDKRWPVVAWAKLDDLRGGGCSRTVPHCTAGEREGEGTVWKEALLPTNGHGGGWRKKDAAAHAGCRSN